MNSKKFSQLPSKHEIKPSATWWSHDRTGWIYFARESTGLFIGIYGVFFLGAWWMDRTGTFTEEVWFKGLSLIALVAAIFHSLTWFEISLKVTPFDIPRWLEHLGFIILLAVWILLSYGLVSFLYA